MRSKINVQKMMSNVILGTSTTRVKGEVHSISSLS